MQSESGAALRVAMQRKAMARLSSAALSQGKATLGNAKQWRGSAARR